MKKLIYIIALLICSNFALSSCGDDGNTWTDYKAWRETNNNWYLEQKERKNDDGTPYYTELNPAWYPQSGVLIHYFNDRSLTAGNLKPMLTSQVAVKYKGEIYDGSVFDSTEETDEPMTFALTDVVVGWQIALTDMHVGDSCEVILPYTVGYGSTGSGSISPYTTLKFGIRLTDIPQYEIPKN